MVTRFEEGFDRFEPGPRDSEEWISITTMGSAYEEELDVRSHPTRYRHRPILLGDGEEAEWQPGPAPRQDDAPGKFIDPTNNLVWTALCAPPTLWDRIRAVFWPRRPPVILTVAFEYGVDADGRTEWSAAEAYVQLSFVPERVRVKIDCRKNGHVMFDSDPLIGVR